MNTLLTPEYSQQYQQAWVNAELCVPQCPDYLADKSPNLLADPSAFAARLSVLAASSAEDFLVTSKSTPHSVREIMWIDAADPYRATVPELPQEQVSALFSEAATFIDTSNEEGLYPSVSWSHDPTTLHRVSIQGEKRVHLHGIARTIEEVADATRSRMRLGDVEPVARRRLLDEFAVVGKSVATDIAQQSSIKLADVHPGLLTCEIGTSERLRDPDFVQQLIQFFGSLQIAYNEIIASLGGEDSFGLLQSFERGQPQLAEQAGRQLHVSDTSVELLNCFLEGMQPIAHRTIRHLAYSSRKHYSKTFIPLHGLAYSVTISPTAGRLDAHMRFCKFSDMGGAGCAVIEGIPTRVFRGKGVMTEEEAQERGRFQSEVAQAIDEKRTLERSLR